MDHKELTNLEMIINQDYPNIAGICVQKNGRNVYENHFHGYTAADSFHVFSVTKSVFSTLIGIAIDQGHIKGTDQPVLGFFPDYEPVAGEKTLQKITIRHLLTMTAPYKYQTEPYEMFFASQNPIRDALDLLGGDGPIGNFHYSAIGGTHILAGILANATGRSVLDFATEYLFHPLGIHVPHNIILRDKEDHIATMNDRNTKGWVVDSQGFNTASWGLFLTPAEMAKIGQLYLDGGLWDGKQIVSAGWIAESTEEHSRCPQPIGLSYGYLWWLIDKDSYAAMGDGGNAIYVNTRNKLVIALAAVFLPDVKDSIPLIKEYIEPLFA